MRIAWGLVTLVVVAALAVAWATAPHATSPAARVATLEREVRCLSCGELDVAQSKSAEAFSMAAFIRHEVAAGASNQQILDSLVATYGDGVLMAPPARGLSLYLWLLPLVVAGGLGWELVVGRRRAGVPEPLSGGSLGELDLVAVPRSSAAEGRVGARTARVDRRSRRRPAARRRRHEVPRWVAWLGAALMLLAGGVGTGLALAPRAPTSSAASVANELRLGETLAAFGATAQAERAFEAALVLDPTNATAMAYEGWLRFNTARTSAARSSALALLDAAASNAPQDAAAQLFDGFGLFYGRHDTPGALERLAAFVRDRPARRLAQEAAPLALPVYRAAHEPTPAIFR